MKRLPELPPDEVSRRLLERYGAHKVGSEPLVEPLRARDVFGRPTVIAALVWTSGWGVFVAYRLIVG